MEQLLARLRPITTNFFFIEGDLTPIANTFIKWQTPLVEEYGNRFEQKVIHQNLETALLNLNPLTTADARTYLLLPTKSKWCAFFDNGILGTDASAPNVVSDLMKTRLIRAVYDGRRGDIIFEYSDYNVAEFGLVRAVSVTKESKWAFNQYGAPLAFEKTALYSQKSVKSRLTPDVLKEYLNHFDISFLEEDFYTPEKGAVLISKKGPKFPSVKEVELKDYDTYFR